MKTLKVILDVSKYELQSGYWSGGGFVPDRCMISGDINVYQNIKPDKYPTPWFVKTLDCDYDVILLYNSTFYDMRVTVNGELFEVPGKQELAVPESIVLTEAFIDLCHHHAIYDKQNIIRAYCNLSRLTWQTGVNSFMEVAWQ